MAWLKAFSLFAALGAAIVSAEGMNHEVTVGKDGKLTFVPENIVAAAGDTVTYHFFPKVRLLFSESHDLTNDLTESLCNTIII